MIIFIREVGIFIELVALLLFFIAVYYVYKIYYLTSDSKKVWGLIVFGFTLVIFRRTLSFFVNFMSESSIKVFVNNFIVPILLLLVSFAFLSAFYKLSRLCEEIVRHKVNKGRVFKKSKFRK